MKPFVVMLTLLAAVSLSPAAGFSQHQHGQHGGMAGAEGEKKAESTLGNETSSNRTFLLEGGVKAAFSIMAMPEHKKMLQDMKMKVDVDPQATHNIAVTLSDTRTNLPIADAVVKMKVIDPKGQGQVRLLDFIAGMNQYAGDFTLSGKGRYQVLILFKTGGKKQAGGFYYRLK
jgi:hypothetical protein